MREFGLWLSAVRPRTLVLAFASVLTGLALAAPAGGINWLTASLTVLTALLLQVLSNLANDYGDSLHGLDGTARTGPVRAVQGGQVTLAQMRRAAILSALLAAAAGLVLVRLALGQSGLLLLSTFLLLGGAAIWAAIAYTATAKPYGYAGLGDVMVFAFFGPVAVAGTHFLQVGVFDAAVLLPGAASGLLATAVLNINNIRDLEGDRSSGKLSVPVRLGPARARQYHGALLVAAVTASLVYVLLNYSAPVQLLFLLAVPLLAANLRAVCNLHAARLDPMLKQLAISTLIYSVLFAAGHVLA